MTATHDTGDPVSAAGQVPDAVRAGGLVVWVLPDAAPLPAWANHPHPLAAAELARVARTRHPRAREQFVRGRTVIRAALSLALGVPPHRVPIVLTLDGKPHLDPAAGLPPLHFNVSHTDGAAVFAVGPVPVGVDVECVQADRDLTGLVDRFFAVEEREQFHRLPAPLRPAGFLRGWTCKEALLKGVGSGVRDLQNCAVDLDPRCQPGVRRCPPGGGAWELTCWGVSDRIAAAAAVRVG